jgi:hypothetical protein
MSDSTVMNITVVIIAVGGNIFVAFVVIKMSTWAIFAKGWIGKAAGVLNAKTGGLTNRAQKFAENRGIYQRNQAARNQREQERQRRAVEGVARVATNDGWRGRMFRRKAAGGLSAQVMGTLTGDRFGANMAGQERALQNAQDQQRKLRHEEADRAAKRMVTLGIEGDTDLENIALGGGYVDPGTGAFVSTGQFNQTRGGTSAGVGAQTTGGTATGVGLQVGHAEQQAAINALVAQGRIGRLRDLEAVSARGAGGTPRTELHHMLDEAYTTTSNKIGDKAPDLMPNRRATNGVAAFTDLQPKDVSAWHQSTVLAAEHYYNAAPAGNAEKDQALRAFSEAASNTSTLASLSPEQVANFRNMMERHRAAGNAVPNNVRTAINDAYTRKGGKVTDLVPPL